MQRTLRILKKISIFLIVPFLLTYWAFIFVYPMNPPMKDDTAKYSMNFGLSWEPPFVFKYYLYTPANYDASTAYPLVLMLHGSSRHMYGGIDAASDDVQSSHPMFVVVPIAPPGFTWGVPHGLLSAAPMAYQAVRNVQSSYNIDEKRIYVTGYSMGGIGTFNMVRRYPDFFAAAAPLCGGWPDGSMEDFEKMAATPFRIYHGADDSSVPVSYSRDAADALKTYNADVDLTIYPGVDHNVWDYAYKESGFWGWLTSQRRP